MKYLAPALLALFVLRAHSAPAGPASALDRLAWLAGSWGTPEEAGAEGPPPRLSEELWMAPRGGLMLGVHRDLAGTPLRARAFEFLRIEERADLGLVLLASPNGRPATEFALAELADGEVVFENPEHDFPQRISYRAVGDGLEVRAEDLAGDRRLAWTWTRRD